MKFIDLTTIRERLAPPPRLSAMEEARRLDDQERRREWAWAIGTTALVVAVVMLWTVALVQWMKP